MKSKWILTTLCSLALAAVVSTVSTSVAQDTKPPLPLEKQPAFEQLRRYSFPEKVNPKRNDNLKGARALYMTTLELWAENGLTFIDPKNNSIDWTKKNSWLEKWKKRGETDILADDDYTGADLLAHLAVDELGRFNYYLAPAAVASENHGADPTVVGIGARFELDGMEETLAKLPKDSTEEDADKALVVDDAHQIRLYPFKGSPAEKAGLKEGDVLKSVDGEAVKGKKLSDVIKLIKGKQGSRLILDVERTPTKEQVAQQVAAAVGAVFANPFVGGAPAATINDKPTMEKITITRDKFTYPVVHVTKHDDNIVVIKYDNWSAGNGLGEMREALLEVRKMKLEQKLPVKVILDLRGNPGGLLDFAVQIAAWMLPEGTITTIKEREGYSVVTKRWSVTRDGLFYTYPAAVNPQRFVAYEVQKHDLILPEDVPLVVLINGNSYSASELMAGAMQANRRAIIVGMPTGGKGEGQQVYDLPNGRRGKVIKFFFAPGDREIDWAGVHPDEGWQVEWKQGQKKGEDNQLDSAKKAVKQEYDRIEKERERYRKIMEDGTKERKAKWEKEREESRQFYEEMLRKNREKREKEAAEKKAASAASPGSAKGGPAIAPSTPASGSNALPTPAPSKQPTTGPTTVPSSLPTATPSLAPVVPASEPDDGQDD